MITWSTWAPAILLVGFLVFRHLKFRRIKNQIPALTQNGAVIIDVRSAAEFESGANPRSVNIPLDRISSAPLPYSKDDALILCCASGTRSGIAVGILKSKGFKTVLNAGPWTNTL